MKIVHHRDEPTFSTSYLERLCPEPRPMRSLGDWERRHHQDLASKAMDELASEGRRARRRADYDPDPARRQWFLERVDAITRELNSRRPQLEYRTPANDSSFPIPRGLGRKESFSRRRGVRLVGGSVVSE